MDDYLTDNAGLGKKELKMEPKEVCEEEEGGTILGRVSEYLSIGSNVFAGPRFFISLPSSTTTAQVLFARFEIITLVPASLNPSCSI